MKIIVTGSQTFRQRAAVWVPLNKLREAHGTPENPLVVFNGKAKDGLDQLVSEWTEEYEEEGVREIPFYANWTPAPGVVNKQAGFIRNQAMIDEGLRAGVDMVLAWANPCHKGSKWCPRRRHATHGTADCVERARAAGIPVHFSPHGMSW